jgi:dihydropteroate synthase
VAAAAVQAGALLVNDISCGALDPNMFSAVAALEVPYIGMHMRGDPNTMSRLTDYKEVTQAVLDYFTEKTKQVNQAGIRDFILDPGFGFAKTLEQNYALLSQMETLQIFELPVLVGVSRKSMIYKALDITAEEALNGTTVLHTYALQKGADILRVHDVKQAMEVIHLVDRLKVRTPASS